MRRSHLATTCCAAALAAGLVLVADGVRADDDADAERIAIDATHGIAPQPERVVDSFRRARPLETEHFDGMLICEVDVQGEGWDGSDPLGPVRRYMGRVELEARVTLPTRTDPIRYLGSEDNNHGTFAIAGTTVDRGDVIGITLVDRDIFDDDPIATFTLTYDGSLPIHAEAEHATIECRGVETSALRGRIADAVEAADDAFADLESADPPDPRAIGFRDSDANPAPTELAIYDIARLVGLADARFLQRRDRLREKQAEMIESISVLVSRLLRSATPLEQAVVLSGSRVTLRVDKYDCEVDDVLAIHPELGLDAPMECALHVTLTSASSTSVSHAFHVTDAQGRTVPLTRFGSIDDEVHRLRSIRVDGELHLVFAVPLRRAVMLRVSRRRSIQWFGFDRAADATPTDDAPGPGGGGDDAP